MQGGQRAPSERCFERDVHASILPSVSDLEALCEAPRPEVRRLPDWSGQGLSVKTPGCPRDGARRARAFSEICAAVHPRREPTTHAAVASELPSSTASCDLVFQLEEQAGQISSYRLSNRDDSVSQFHRS